MIPNAALRFQPTDEMRTEFMARMEKERANMPDSLKRRFQSQGGFGGQSRSSFGSGSRGTRGTFWYVDKNGNPEMGFAVRGLTDGRNTEIIRSRIAKEGTEVITGFETQGDEQTRNSNLLGPNRNMPRGIRRGF